MLLMPPSARSRSPSVLNPTAQLRFFLLAVPMARMFPSGKHCSAHRVVFDNVVIDAMSIYVKFVFTT